METQVTKKLVQVDASMTEMDGKVEAAKNDTQMAND